jgi:hypothetical protein
VATTREATPEPLSVTLDRLRHGLVVAESLARGDTAAGRQALQLAVAAAARALHAKGPPTRQRARTRHGRERVA